MRVIKRQVNLSIDSWPRTTQIVSPTVPNLLSKHSTLNLQICAWDQRSELSFAPRDLQLRSDRETRRVDDDVSPMRFY